MDMTKGYRESTMVAITQWEKEYLAGFLVSEDDILRDMIIVDLQVF